MFAVGLDPGDATSDSVAGPSEVVLDVLAGRHHLTLKPAIHPVEADLRVEVDVDLVGMEDRLAIGARST